MNMKTGANKRLIKALNKASNLLSRINGVGIAGLNSYPPKQNEERSIPTKGSQTAENKTGNTEYCCQNQNHCRDDFDWQPRKYQDSQVSVDLWFYLSGQG